MRVISQVGGRLPAYRTATGKALLRQDLVRTRARGYAVKREDTEVGVSAVAVTAATRGLRPDRVVPVVCAAARAPGRGLARR
ncbi:IclR family transcriptional regulator C-terminal domain-containing protein [Streptomyces sp. NPDC008238]